MNCNTNANQSTYTALGCSGTWVTRDGVLCGMIIAGYESEPFAHMIPAAQLFADVESSLSAGTKSKVTLFQGRPTDWDVATVHGSRPQLVPSTANAISSPISGTHEFNTGTHPALGGSSQLFGFALEAQQEISETSPYYNLVLNSAPTHHVPLSSTADKQEKPAVAVKPPEGRILPFPNEKENSMRPFQKAVILSALLAALLAITLVSFRFFSIISQLLPVPS